MDRNEERTLAAVSLNAAYVKLLRHETVRPTPALVESSYSPPGDEDLPVEPYLSQDWFQREVDQVWKKTWQFACREDELLTPGDYVVYDVVGLSLLVVRGSDEQIRAMHNFCQHRGRKLRPQSGHVSQLRCPFHGWTWDVNGAIAHIPCRSDFRPFTDDEVRLPPARVATWAGFVFVNFDLNAPPLEQHLGRLQEHFAPWGLGNAYTVAHVRKRIPCNWKLGIEAFIEAYHTLATHPQIAPYTGDLASQVDTYEGENFNRMLTPVAVQSGQMDRVYTEQQILEASTTRGSGRLQKVDVTSLQPGMTARQIVAESQRAQAKALTGADYSKVSDADMLDIIQYLMFPNFLPWGGFVRNIVYQFRPDGMRVESALLDVYLLQRFDPKGPRPPSRQLNILTDEEPWAAAEELGGLGPIFDQDMDNMGYVQEGLGISRATKAAVTISKYHEARIRDFHRQLQAALGQ
jgi:phenylpropionate dioxygenase-like ring-hydroxylating dioxygenase large terminal subunit